MGSSARYVLKIGDNYYFRLKVPCHIKRLFNRTQIKKSLRTNNLKTALLRATILRSFTLTLFRQLEVGMVDKKKMDEFYDELMKQIVPADEDFFVDFNKLNNDESLPDILPAGVGESIHVSKAVAQTEADCEKEKHLAVEQARKDGQGSVEEILDQMRQIVKPATENSTVETDSSELILNDLLDCFIQEKEAADSWTRNTKISVMAHFDILRECFGTDSVKQITRVNMVNLLNNVLKKLPKRRNRIPELKKLTLQKQLEDTAHEKLSVKSIQDYMISISNFFNWCVERGYIDRNPALKLAPKDRRVQSDKRLAYSKSELQLIITELSKLSHRGIVGKKNIDNTWIVLLGMFIGARQNEICQLFIDDIVNADSVPCINFNARQDTGQSLKNASSCRVIPIHNTLLKLGFLDFVNTERVASTKHIKKAGEKCIKDLQLFKSMNKAEARDNYARNFLNFYTKFKSKISSNPKKSFHSLRHNFSSMLMNSSAHPYLVSELTGHTNEATTTAKIYTHTEIEKLHEELNRLDYGFNIFKIFDVNPLSDEEIAEQVKLLPEME